MAMLIDKKIISYKDDVIIFKDVGVAIMEDYADFFELIDSIKDDEEVWSIKQKLGVHLKSKNYRFGEYARWKKVLS